MANERQPPDPSGFEAENEIDLVLGKAYPNPNREGCPPRELLIALARRERPIGDPAYKHLFQCSPCYREARSLQQAVGERREGFEPAPQSRRSWFAAAAVLVLVSAAVAWLFLTRADDRAPGNMAPSASDATLSAELDLRKYAVMRGGDQQTQPAPISLPRGRLNLTLLLPVGSEPGEYEIQVLDGNLVSRASTTGEAEIRDFVTTLHASLEISALPSGSYQLAIRRRGDDWRMFPVEVK